MTRFLALRPTAALVFFYCFMICTATHAQVTEQEREDRAEMANIDQDHDKVFKIHPLHYGEVFVSYEKVRAPGISNEFGLNYFYKLHMKGDGWSTNIKDVMGIGIRMSQRYYTSKKKPAPFGFFHGPMFSYRFIVFERNVFDLPDVPPSDPDFRYVGRLYQNAIDLSYHLGYQFRLGRHFTTELSGGLGGRVKIANATNGGDLIRENIIGHVMHSDEGAVFTVGPSPQLNFSIGYSF
ncbi:ABC transporter ATP-binding protein [Pontibacter sp. FD36]|uniref:ABC transporter ATP-binding protein n=1 Tax=Pontibacter sp. FD36 TaxID=2789860 RepID=UPI001E5D2B8A|nr:ABC transporter ATP-binding protein [Pontibacter sp. FD36]